jgi:hypothetical protein
MQWRIMCMASLLSLFCVVCGSEFGVPLIAGEIATAPGPAPDAARAALERVLADYTGLYAGPTLERWKTLFHPSLTVASSDKDGTILVRTLDQFYGAQKARFASGRNIGERLENVRIEMGRRIGSVTADFIFLDEGEERPGKLGLHLTEGQDGWRIVAIVFAYDGA